MAWRTLTSSNGLMIVDSARYFSVFAIGAEATVNFLPAIRSATSRGGKVGRDVGIAAFDQCARRVPAAATERYIARSSFGRSPPFQPSNRDSTTCSPGLKESTL